MKYSADDIKIDKFPKINELSNGRREQIWDIVLKKAISRKINLEYISQQLSHLDFSVKIKMKSKKHLNVCVMMIRDPNPYSHDRNLFNLYKMFEEIEELLGAIDTIEGQKMEDRWSPYRKRRKTIDD